MSVQQANCVVRFGDLPEFRGRAGAKMSGRGVEIWLMREGRIAVWEAAFNVKEVGKASALGIV